jgi:Fe-S-cluster containining protein
MVPISEMEARRLAQLVEELPEPRRSIILGRFATALARVKEAGMIETLRHFDESPIPDRLPFVLSYFHLGIACPFLEAESCSIHFDRPLSCREYLVTSPAANCATPTAEAIERVEMPARISRALRAIDCPAATGAMPRMPLVLALEFASRQPNTLSPRPGLEWLTLLLQPLHVRPIDSASV